MAMTKHLRKLLVAAALVVGTSAAVLPTAATPRAEAAERLMWSKWVRVSPTLSSYLRHQQAACSYAHGTAQMRWLNSYPNHTRPTMVLVGCVKVY